MGVYQQDREGLSAGVVLLAFLAGTALGTVAALLLAPQSGEESREQLRRYARRTGDNLRNFAGKAEERWETVIETGRKFIQSKRHLNRAVDTGRKPAS